MSLRERIIKLRASRVPGRLVRVHHRREGRVPPPYQVAFHQAIELMSTYLTVYVVNATVAACMQELLDLIPLRRCQYLCLP